MNAVSKRSDIFLAEPLSTSTRSSILQRFDMYSSVDIHGFTAATACLAVVLPSRQDLVAKRRNGANALAGRFAS
jgi:hypothetical protein